MSVIHDFGLGTNQKALKINLDKNIYGTFAEIGAGQDVAGAFFKAGGASGTIAKSMSAYDMKFSDAIYGPVKDGRYVCQERLESMLDHEYNLLIERLNHQRGENTQFFSIANTVVALNYHKNNEPHGIWKYYNQYGRMFHKKWYENGELMKEYIDHYWYDIYQMYSRGEI